MKRWCLVAALALLAMPRLLGASTFVDMSTGDLVRESSAVVEGEVLKVESYWEPAGRIIVTEALVRVDDLVVGEAPTVVRVKTFGGTVGGYTVEAIGFPTFARGERLVLFLGPDPDPDLMRVTGYQLGQYRVRSGADGHDEAVSAVDGGARFLTPDGRAADRAAQLPLADLKQEIRAAAALIGR
jgi:hypothetical protein